MKIYCISFEVTLQRVYVERNRELFQKRLIIANLSLSCVSCISWGFDKLCCNAQLSR